LQLRRSSRWTLLCAAIVFSAAIFGGCRSSKPQRPNILLITVDTLRADRVGCYGYTGGTTPNVDALAKEGVVFERAVAQVPLTWPSHASILTGTYPFHNRVQDFTGQPLSEQFRTLAESLKANGYATGAVVSSFVLDRSWGLARGFDDYDDAFSGQDFLQKDLALVERRADQSVDHALGWLESHTSQSAQAGKPAEASQPFFLWLHLYDPHSPYDPPEPYRSRFERKPYEGEIAYADSQLGRLVEWLRGAPGNLYDRTMIVVLSDHGESLGEHGEKEHGFFVYDSTVRVPLIIKPARHSEIAPQRVAPAVETIQLAPTVLELAGVADAIEKQFQAATLVPLMTGKSTSAARAAYSETMYPASSFGWSPLRGVENARYHYIEAPKAELYDLDSDPQEKANVTEKNANVAARMAAELNQLLAKYPPPAQGAGGNGSGANPEVLEKLRSLGYVAYKAPSTPDAKLADPKDKLRVYQDVLRATDLMHLGQFAAARSLLGKLQRTELRLYLIPFLLGEAASREGRWKEAEKQFARVAELNAGFDQATMGLARALGFQGKRKKSRDLIRALVSSNPRNFRAWFVLAQIEGKDDPKASREALEKVIAIQPNFAPAYRDRGLLAMREQNYEAGADDLARAVQMGLSDVLTHNALGICYSRMNRLGDAIESYRRAIAADPKYAQAHLNLGFVYERMNQPEMAKQEYEEACRLDRQICEMTRRRQASARGTSR
jgi:arylsulfatase A-like enzyme/Flp pilus assembly protein TadD